VREETQPKEPKCAICHQPITAKQRPSVQVKPGVEVHLECWIREKQENEKKQELLSTLTIAQ